MNNALKEGLMEKMKISEVREASMDMKKPEVKMFMINDNENLS